MENPRKKLEDDVGSEPHFIPLLENVNLLTGPCPASHALQGGVKGHNMKEPPCRKASPFRAGSFTILAK